MMRLFFGVPLTPAATAALESVMARVPLRRGWRPLASHNWHITLSFLGDTDGRHLPALIDLGERVAHEHLSMRVTLDGLQWWPGESRPRLLAAVASDSAPLLALSRDLKAGLRELGVNFDSKPLRAHVTLLRLERGVLVDDPGVPPCNVGIDCDEIALFVSESATSARGAREKRYRPLWRQMLESPPPYGKR
jgi:2'-5' RNA ligase